MSQTMWVDHKRRSQTELLIIVGNTKDFSSVLDKFEQPRKGEGAKAQELKMPLFRKENKNPIRLKKNQLPILLNS